MIRTTRGLMTPLFLLFLGLEPVAAQMTGYDAGGGVFSEIVDIDTETGVGSASPEYSACFTNPTNVFFGGGPSGEGFTVGMAYVGTILYGLEFDAGSYYLYTVGTDGFGCARATRVGGAVGITGLELNSLAYCPIDDVLYTHAFVSGGHMGQLYVLDRDTGAGSSVGSLTGFDFRILGMTCNPATGTLYGITSGHASRFPDVELVTIDRTTSEVTPIGTTGIPAAGSGTNAESLALDYVAMTPRIFAGADLVWEIDLDTGAGTMVGGTYNGQLYAMASRSTGSPGDTPTPTPTSEATETHTPTETSTETSTPTETETGTPTETSTSPPTATETETEAMTDTPTETSTATPLATNTDNPTETPTDSATATETPTSTETPTVTETPEITGTGTGTASPTPTVTPEPLDPIGLLELLGQFQIGGTDSMILFEKSLTWYGP